MSDLPIKLKARIDAIIAKGSASLATDNSEKVLETLAVVAH